MEQTHLNGYSYKFTTHTIILITTTTNVICQFNKIYRNNSSVFHDGPIPTVCNSLELNVDMRVQKKRQTLGFIGYTFIPAFYKNELGVTIYESYDCT